MLDNFGMGEFLVLALFALLFFGPARLPQIGAQLGRWLSKLTSYSKAFMTQWSEEAAAVQGAVQDVMSIRDEIRAAQAEISESLNAAQKDINDTISVAKGTIRQATPTADSLVKSSGAPTLANAEDANRVQGSRAGASGGDDSEAVSKTQDIVNSLLLEQGAASQEDTADEGQDDDATSEDDDAYQKNLAAIQEIMGRSQKNAPDRADSLSTDAPGGDVQQDQAETPPGEPAQTAATQPGTILTGSIAAGQQGEPKPKRDESESPFSKTQRILNQLMGIEPEPEPEPDVPPAIPAQTPVDGAAVESSVPAQPAAEVEVAAMAVETPPALAETPAADNLATRSADAVQRVRGSGTGVSMGEFTKLSIEVGLLKRELRALRQELQTLRAEEPDQAVPAPLPGDEAAAQEGDSPPAMPVEKVA